MAMAYLRPYVLPFLIRLLCLSVTFFFRSILLLSLHWIRFLLFYPTLTKFSTHLYVFVTQISITCRVSLLPLAVELLFYWNFRLMSSWWVSMRCLSLQKWPQPNVWHHRVTYLQNLHGRWQYTTDQPYSPLSPTSEPLSYIWANPSYPCFNTLLTLSWWV